MTEDIHPGHPRAPWLARSEWAARLIKDENRNTGLYLLFFATFWNAISWGITAAIWASPSGRGFEHYFILIFPLIGVLMLVAAIHGLLYRRRYGVARFELATLPAPLGRALAGHVRVGRGLEPDRQMGIRLHAVRRIVTRSGKKTRTKEETLWEDRRTIPGAIRAGAGVVIPVAIAIPRDAPPTDNRSLSDQVVWRLEVKSDVPGVDFAATFEVPVFLTPESETPLTPEELKRLAP